MEMLFQLPVLKEIDLHRVICRILEHAGTSPEEASRVADHLVLSNLTGHDSHGAILLPTYLEQIRKGEIVLRAKIEMARETPSACVLDGNWGFGQVIAKKAMEIAIEKADTHSISLVTVRRSNHIGRLGEYPVAAAQRGMIGMISVNDYGAGQLMAPFGGIDARLSPNPISIAFPSGRDKPILLDMSCSVVAAGKVRVRLNRDERLPEGWIIDAKGQPSTDPRDLFGPPPGAILPLGGLTLGHKGFGLGFVLDVLDGALSGAGCTREGATRIGNAYFIIAMKISDFVPLDEFEKEVERFIEYVKSSPLMPGFKEILVPGESEFREEERRRREGIEIDENTWNQILEAATKVGYEIDLDFPKK